LSLFVFWRRAYKSEDIIDSDLKKKGLKEFFFSKKIWFGKSAIIDYMLIFFNGVFKILFLSPLLLLGLQIAAWTNEYLIDYLGYGRFNLSKTETIIYYTLSITILADFFTFFVHYLMHKIPFLWAFHKTHHSATTLNPITQFRIHPVELVINNFQSMLVISLITGWFDYASNHQISMVTFLGVNVLNFIFLAFGANLRHSHVKLKYFTFIEYIFISPYQHQIHHSNNPKHFNKNLGSKLALWDWMFGTLIKSKDANELKFGLGEEDSKFDSFWKNLFMPFKHATSTVLNIFNNNNKN
jgi:sterol desaturase/sphingolipid hydroxylase (fatty acid hydroxylase superfamily)